MEETAGRVMLMLTTSSLMVLWLVRLDLLRQRRTPFRWPTWIPRPWLLTKTKLAFELSGSPARIEGHQGRTFGALANLRREIILIIFLVRLQERAGVRKENWVSMPLTRSFPNLTETGDASMELFTGSSLTVEDTIGGSRCPGRVSMPLDYSGKESGKAANVWARS